VAELGDPVAEPTLERDPAPVNRPWRRGRALVLVMALAAVWMSPQVRSLADVVSRTESRSAPPCDSVLRPTRTPSGHFPNLDAVGGSGPNDVWVVGLNLDPEHVEPVLWHWNGARWSVAPAGTGTEAADAMDVTSFGPRDAWAVGWTIGSNFIAHWNGHEWRGVPTGLPVDDVNLESIDSVSLSNLWAVGSKESSSGPARVPRSFIVHTTGPGWHTVSQPRGLAVGSVLKGIGVVSRDDIWAVGGTDLGRQLWYDSPRTLIEHWNGHRWSVFPSPSPGSIVNVLQAISVVGPRDVWAVGMRRSEGHAARPLVLHYDGSSWTEAPTPWIGGTDSDLFDVSSSPSAGTWAFGRRSDSHNTHPLVERLSARGWVRVHQAPRWGSLHGGWATEHAVWTVGQTKSGNHVISLTERACLPG
jgi:hypothetical protein